MSQRAYCDQPHPGSGEEATLWCERYHRPATPVTPDHSPQPDSWTNALTDEALAHRLTLIATRMRSFSVSERNALLAEAAWRIQRGRPLDHIA